MAEKLISIKRECPLCGKRFSDRGYVLRDHGGENVGVYCSRNHATMDAWGPRFRPSFFVRIERAKR